MFVCVREEINRFFVNFFFLFDILYLSPTPPFFLFQVCGAEDCPEYKRPILAISMGLSLSLSPSYFYSFLNSLSLFSSLGACEICGCKPAKHANLGRFGKNESKEQKKEESKEELES